MKHSFDYISYALGITPWIPDSHPCARPPSTLMHGRMLWIRTFISCTNHVLGDTPKNWKLCFKCFHDAAPTYHRHPGTDPAPRVPWRLLQWSSLLAIIHCRVRLDGVWIWSVWDWRWYKLWHIKTSSKWIFGRRTRFPFWFKHLQFLYRACEPWINHDPLAEQHPPLLSRFCAAKQRTQIIAQRDW